MFGGKKSGVQLENPDGFSVSFSFQLVLNID